MPRKDNSPEFIARERYEVPDNPKLDDVADIDRNWAVQPDIEYPRYSNYFEVGDKVVSPFGERGVIVGIEYLGKVRKPIYWVKWESNPNYPQPELGEALVRADLLNDMLFKRIQASIGGDIRPRDEVLMSMGLVEGIVAPGSYGFVSELSSGSVRIAMYISDKDEIEIYDENDLSVADVFGVSFSLRLPVKLSWLDTLYPPQIAFNAVKERGLI